MGHYKSNVRDLEFNLFEVLGLEQPLSEGVWGDLDADTVRNMLSEVARLAEGPLGESFADADRNPPVFDPENHTVTLPESFKKSFRALWDAEWYRMGLSEEIGGVPVPRSVVWAIGELILGAQPAAHMYQAGPAFADVLFHNGTEEQKKWAATCVERGWGATMVLTEPDAGSDVGAGRTKAIKQDDGSWHIEGVKRFITSADSDDLFENIFHLVLARPEGAGPGTKGLSLFFVPKTHFNFETNELGERNGVFVTNVEHKMGLKVSATCEVTFGGHGIPAQGWLVGEVHNGIAQMFDVIEHARMMVGTKAIATLSTGYLNALDYAKERVQGADLTQMTDKPRRVSPSRTTPTSVAHSPCRRRTRRACAPCTCTPRRIRRGHRQAGVRCRQGPRVPRQRPAAPHRQGRRLRAGVPVPDGQPADLRCSGFLQDYPIEQYIRDAKIDSLYEGTTAIQAQDFFFRKIARDRGVALAHVAGEVKKFIDSEAGNGRLKAERALLATALEDVQTMAATLTGYLMGAQEQPSELYKVGLGSVRFLMSVGDLLIGWQLLRQSEIAIKALDEGASDKDKAFYEARSPSRPFSRRTSCRN